MFLLLLSLDVRSNVRYIYHTAFEGMTKIKRARIRIRQRKSLFYNLILTRAIKIDFGNLPRKLRGRPGYLHP